MKSKILVCGAVLVLAAIIAQPVSAQGDLPVTVDGWKVAFDVPPQVRDGRTLVPFRALAESFGVTVFWDEAERAVRANDGQTKVFIPVNQQTARVNGEQVALDVPATIVEGRTVVPLRFFSEAFRCRVEWLGHQQGIKILSPPSHMTLIGFYALGSTEASSWTNLFGVPYPAVTLGNTDLVDELALGWFSLASDGRLLVDSKTGWRRPVGWEDVLERAGQFGLRTEMVVHVTDDDGTVTALLSREATMEKAVEEIIAQATHFDGVNLNIESLGWRKEDNITSVRESFNAFVELLAEQLPKPLTLTLHPPNSVYQGYDYQRLGELADRLIVMAYEYGSVPEPADLVAEAVEMALASVPAQKLILGISAASESPDSILTKVGIAKRYRLPGIALWRLGLISDGMWASLRETISP